MLYNNQKVIRIIKAKSDKDNIYGLFNKSSMYAAMQSLSPNGFKLWCYLNCNQQNYQFGLSLEDVQRNCGMARATYYRVVDELIEKNYLVDVQLTDKISGYVFLEEGALVYGMAAQDVSEDC